MSNFDDVFARYHEKAKKAATQSAKPTDEAYDILAQRMAKLSASEGRDRSAKPDSRSRNTAGKGRRNERESSKEREEAQPTHSGQGGRGRGARRDRGDAEDRPAGRHVPPPSDRRARPRRNDAESEACEDDDFAGHARGYRDASNRRGRYHSEGGSKYSHERRGREDDYGAEDYSGAQEDTYRGRAPAPSRGKRSHEREAHEEPDRYDRGVPRRSPPGRDEYRGKDEDSNDRTRGAPRRDWDWYSDDTKRRPNGGTTRDHARDRHESERRKQAELEEEIYTLKKNMVGDGTTHSGPSTSAREEQLKQLQKEKELAKRRAQEQEESIRRWERELETKGSVIGTKSMEELREEREREVRDYDRYYYGIDICFLLDCTGSMYSWMRTAGEKIRDVMDIAPAKFSNAMTRVAFVGYRDHCDGNKREEVYDFVEDVSELKAKILKMPATGGGDAPEDIAGGLNNATKLAWKSSTRLVIHIADAPCHGRKYHGSGDDHPDGDPHGLVPEDLLRRLCNKSVDYYFVKINNSTDQMTAIFEQVYLNSGRTFQQFNIGNNPAEFLPMVIKSVTSSMARSESFKSAGMGLIAY